MANGQLEHHHLQPDPDNRVCFRPVIDRLLREATGQPAPRLSWAVRMMTVDGGAELSAELVRRFLAEAWDASPAWIRRRGVLLPTAVVMAPELRAGTPERYSLPHVELALTEAPNGLWPSPGISVAVGGRRRPSLECPLTLLRAHGWTTRAAAICAGVATVHRWLDGIDGADAGDIERVRELANAHTDRPEPGRQRELF